MTNDVRVRPLAPLDRDRWLQLRSELWPRHPLETLTREVDAFLTGDGLWKLGRESIPFLVLVAEREAEGIVGFLEASLRPFADGCRTAPVGYLEGWYVAPAHRRRGIGSALVRAAEGWARSSGCREMASDARVDNVTSELCHRALGYEVVHRTIHFRRDLDGPSGPDGPAATPRSPPTRRTAGARRRAP